MIQRARLGFKYIFKYLSDELFRIAGLQYPSTKPLDMLCEITYNCNLKCPTCFRWTSRKDEHELGLKDWENIILNLERWLGIYRLSIGGGEPFLKEETLNICKFASRHGAFVSVVTNGSLIDKTLAKNILSSGLDALSLSLNSLKPEIHNMTRGTATSFDEVMKAIENLRDRRGMRLTISTTVMSENINDLVDLTGFVKSQGLDGINFQPLMGASTFPVFDKSGQFPKSSEGKLYSKIGENAENIDSIFERLMSMRKEGYPINNSLKHLRWMAKYLQNPANPELSGIPCKIGFKNFFIDPFGNVRICMVMEPIGNITKEAPENIWNSEKAQAHRETILKCHKTCRLLNCNFKELDLCYKVRNLIKKS